MPIRFKSNNELIGDKGFLIRGEQIPCDSGSSLQLAPSRPFGHSLLYSNPTRSPSLLLGSRPYAHESASSNHQPTYFMHRMGSSYPHSPSSQFSSSASSVNRRNHTFTQAPYLLPYDATRPTSGRTRHSALAQPPPSDHGDRYLRDLPVTTTTSSDHNHHGRDLFSCNQVISDPLFEITSPHYPYR